MAAVAKAIAAKMSAALREWVTSHPPIAEPHGLDWQTSNGRHVEAAVHCSLHELRMGYRCQVLMCAP